MKQFIYFILLLITCSLTKEIVRPGRSGDAVVIPPFLDDNSFMYLIHRNPSKSSQIDENSVADLIGQNLGLGVISPHASRAALPEETPFDKSRSNVLVYVDSIPTSLTADWTLFSQTNGQTIKINKEYYPQDAVAQAATFVTGQSPEVHGMVLGTWKHNGQDVRAYEEALPDVGNVVDTLSKTFNGKALTVSASADFQIAAALGAHRILLESQPSWENHVFSWNATTKNFDSAASSAPHDFFNFDQVFNKISALSGSPFDKTRVEDVQFLAEIELLNLFIDNLESHPSVMDEIPDSFNFGISSIRTLLTRYRTDAALVETASTMLDNILVKLVNKLEAVYGNKFSFQLIVQPPTAYQILAANKGLHEKIDYVPLNRLQSEFFPVLYGKNAEKVCEGLQRAAGQDYIVSCHDTPSHVFQPVNGVPFFLSSEESAGYIHLYLWTSVALILAIYASIYATAYMDIGIDSPLYRATTMKDPVKLD